jgi:hypothetical protein
MREFNDIRCWVSVDRKENRPEDCVVNDLNKIPQRIKDMLKSLPTIDTSLIVDYDDEGIEHPINLDNFSLFDDYFDREQFWILKHKGKNYFVDTQGYSYARYCGGLEGDL